MTVAWLVIVVVIVVIFLVSVLFCCYKCCTRLTTYFGGDGGMAESLNKAAETEQDPNGVEAEAIVGLHVKKFTFKELRDATDSFNESAKIGEGAFGDVYKGKLRNYVVAVKRLYQVLTEKEREAFITEVYNCGRIRHRNLANLIGYCSEPQGLLIVFDYIGNGTLSNYLFDSSPTQTPPLLLSWEDRRKIALGLAAGLHYLHNGCTQCMIHRDIKPGNVLVDTDLTPKLADFGCARFTDHGQSIGSTSGAGTYGYIAPEITNYGDKATPKSDVFSFGVVLLHIATGRKDLLVKHVNLSLVSWVWYLNSMGQILEAVDPRLANESYNSDEAACMMRVGLACCHGAPSERPNMDEVISMLQGKSGVEVKPLHSCYMKTLMGIKPDVGLVNEHENSGSHTPRQTPPSAATKAYIHTWPPRKPVLERI